MSADPRTMFPNFYGNPAIKVLSKAKRWTISGRLDNGSDESLKKRKAPIDVRHLIDTGGRVRGAWARDAQCLVDLPELTAQVPAAANAAFYLQSVTDGLMVIDIEPGCPPEVARNILALPGAIYTETSMSGKGYHLVTPLPKNFHGFPIATAKKVIRESHGWYEILLEHWATFTRRPIDERVMAAAQDIHLASAPFSSIEDLYESLARTAKATATVSTEFGTAAEAPEVAGSEEIIEKTLSGIEGRLKSIDDFDGDHSRFEFSVLGTLYLEMRRHVVLVGFIRRTNYSLSDRSWLLYQAAQKVLPKRAKHNEQRNGRPFLLDRAAAMVAMQPNN